MTHYEEDAVMTTRTMTVTGAAKGIGAAVTKAFIDRGYNVVANSLDFTNSALAPAEKLALVDGVFEGPVAGGNDLRCRRHCRRNRLPGEARQVTGEVLRVDAGAHNGKW